MTKISGISLLTEARGHIAAGWVQGRFFSSHGGRVCCCAQGAMMLTAGAGAFSVEVHEHCDDFAVISDYSEYDRAIQWLVADHADPDTLAALAALSDAMVETVPFPRAPHRSSLGYIRDANDEAKSVDDVLAAFDLAIERLTTRMETAS
jgi:hypothetical protein